MKRFSVFFSVFLFFAFLSFFCSVALAEEEIPVNSITVEALEGIQNITPGHTVHMGARLLPEGATNKSVVWSVINGTGSASISADGILSCEQAGTVTVRASANDGSGVYGECQIEISNFLGEGTQSDPYRIENAQDLSRLASLVNAGNSPYANKNYIQTQDIDLSQYSDWIPIGRYMSMDSNYMFCGVYDGNGNSIAGLHMEINTDTVAVTGLFGCLNGQVKNVSLKDTNINIQNSKETTYAGTIAGYMQYGRIEHCTVEGTVQAKGNDSSNGYAGGIAGRIYSNCSIEDCAFSGVIALSAHHAYAGGTVGYSSYSISIRNCACAGRIRAEGSLVYAAGIAGYMNISETKNIIAGCYNEADVSHYTTNLGYSSSAGIVGYVGKTNVSNCFNAGKISADNSNAGGIAGEYNNDPACAVINCYNTGLVTGAVWCGGIVAHVRGTVGSLSHCYYLDNTQSCVGAGPGTALKKTWDELIVQSTYEGFDFTDIWTMEPAVYSQTHYKLPQIRTNLYYPPYNPVSLSLNPEGAGNISGSGTYFLGEPVTITALPSTGYHFIRWEVTSGNITLSSTTDLSVTFAMPAEAVEIVAVFEKDQYNLTINNDGNGVATGGGLHTWGENVQINAEAAAGYRFSNWEVVSGGVTINDTSNAQSSFVMPQNEVIVKAHFAKIEYTVTVNTEGDGVAKGGGTYAWGDEVKISAEPETGYHFKNWEVKSGNITLSSTTDLSVTFAMPAEAVEIEAVFEKDQYNLTINNDGNGVATGGGLHTWGENVQINAEAAAGYRFSSWEVVSGGVTINDTNNAQSSFVMPQNEVIVKAHFAKIEYTVTVNTEGSGTVTGGGVYTLGGLVRLNAMPAAGYHLKKWDILSANITLISNTDLITAFDMPAGSVEIIAIFEKDQYKVTVVNGGNGTVTGNGLHAWGEEVTISAKPETGYRFKNWEIVSGSVTVSNTTAENLSFIMPQGEVAIKANFEKERYSVSIEKTGDGIVAGDGTYDADEEVSISATPADGYRFKNWEVKSGNIKLSNATNPTVSFAMPAESVEIIAVFEKDQYSVIIEDVLTGQVQEKKYCWDETVKISHKPPEYYCFSHWEVIQGGIAIDNPSNAQSSFTMPKNNVVIKAYAEKKKYVVLMADNQNGLLYGSGFYSWDTIVYISAVPEPGYCFKNWKVLTGQNILANASFMDTGFIMPKSDILLQAVFEKIRCTVDIKSDESGTEKGGGTYDWGSKVTLTARPKDGFRFVCWKKDGLILSYDYDYTFTVKSSDTIQAVYEPIGIPVINTVESTGFDSIRVAWKPVAGAGGYIVCCATSAEGVYREIENIAGNTEYIMNGLTMAKPYFFRVKAYCKTGNTLSCGSLSSYKFASPAPAVPPAFKAIISGKKIKLSWGKVEKATKYELYRVLSPNGKYKRLANTSKTGYTDKISKGKTYYYKVRAYYKKNKKTYYYSGFADFIIKP